MFTVILSIKIIKMHEYWHNLQFFVPLQDDPHTNLLIEAIKNDSLRQIERER